MAEEDDDEDRKRQRDEIFKEFDKKRQKFAVTTPQAPLPLFAQIILDIITNPEKAAELITDDHNMVDVDVYGLELALKNTPFRTFFEKHDIWNRYRKTHIYAEMRARAPKWLPENYSPRWRYFTVAAIDEIFRGNGRTRVLFINPNAGKSFTITLKDNYDDKTLFVTDETPVSPPVDIVSPTVMDIPSGKTSWSVTIGRREPQILDDIAGQIIYNLFATGYMYMVNKWGSSDSYGAKEYGIGGRCLTCNQKAKLCETGDETRVFCGETCQGKYYK
jgi:hypothetical protein